MTPDPPAPRVTPPKLDPVRVQIPEEAVAARVTDFREVLHAYSREAAVLEAKRCIQCRRPWCVEACPISQDCKEYIRLIAADDFEGAARVTLQDDPLATTLCKVCYHYCEESCVITKKGVPIAIRHLKRAALDFGDSERAYIASRPKSQRVAVVGAGPAGLMAAWDLGVRGYSVSVFEQAPEEGGLIRTIPAYRMSDADLREDLARYRGLDVTFVENRKIGRDSTVADLLTEGYVAVFLALGTPDPRRLGVPGEDLPGVVPALEFLRASTHEQTPPIGAAVVVVGGGDVAMDSIRTARRLSPGGNVTLVYRRGRDEMPADPEELQGAEAEGIRFLFHRAPVRIVGDGRVEGIVVQTMELGPPDDGGRRSPRPVPGSDATIACDTVLVAVGQRADVRGFPDALGLRLSARGWPEGTGPGYTTNIPGVFAAGGRSVVYAMGAAMEAVVAIDEYLAKLRGDAPTARPDPFGGPGAFRLPLGYTKPIRAP